MTLLVKNVRILDGNGGSPLDADVFVSGGKISAIGKFPDKDADKVLDGGGAYLAPGFIDVDTDSDHYLSIFENPAQEDFLKQGVTSILGGMCGSSLAPLLYGSLESVQKWGDVRKINVGWHSMEEFLAFMRKKPLAVNFGTLVGHATIRRAIIGESMRELTKNELNVYVSTLQRALDEGGLGFSTGLGYVHASETPYSELKLLAQVVQKTGGVYATHLRKSGNAMGESIDETVKLTKETGISAVVSHMMPLVGAEKAYEDALRKIESLPEEMNFHFDMYPYDTSMLPLYTFLPPWARTGGIDSMIAIVKDPWFHKRLEEDFDDIDADEFIVAQAPGNGYFVGRSLRQLAHLFEVPNSQIALRQLMKATELHAIVLYRNIDNGYIKRGLKSPRSLVASNAAAMGAPGPDRVIKPERAKSTFTKFLYFAEHEDLMPLAAAIKKITRDPAQKFGLAGRGIIREDAYADFVIFKEQEIRHVAVNGTLVLEGGAFANAFPGQVLTHARS